jgi:phage baseplate assembly protein W
MALKPSRSFRDLSLTFSKNPISDDLVILKDENAIKRALLNLFSVRKGEKLFNAEFGSSIPDLLFEPFDFATASEIKSEVTQLINAYEPRITLLEVLVNLDTDNYFYEIQIDYLIPDKSNQVNNVSLSLASSTRV